MSTAALAAVAAVGLLGSPTPASAASCGAEGQRPCKLWERIPSCNKGLVEDFSKGRCLRRTRPGIDCGRANQRACKIWERVPSCNKGLVEVLGKGICVRNNPGVICGRENQRPCTLTERIPSCNSGLVEDFLRGKCIATANTPRYRLADQKLRQMGGMIASKIGFAKRVASDPRVKTALKNDRRSVARYVKSSAVGPTRTSDGKLLRTLTIGASAGAKVFIGGSAGAGAAIDLAGRRPAYVYGTADYSASIGIGASTGVDVGFWVCQNNKIGGDSWGIEFSPVELVKAAQTFADLKQAFKPGLDVGVALWFDYRNVFQGFTITPNVGAGVDFGGLVKAGTLVDGDPNVNCDGSPKRAADRGRRPAPETLVQTLRHGGGMIRHTKIDGGASSQGVTRVCLRNRTTRQKSLRYQFGRINPLIVPPRGRMSCANFPSNRRLNFNWVDNGRVVKRDGMNLGAYAGDVVIFDWRRH
ncbi:MAG: hypothetical protein AAF909_08155 [Pseudomonadota bacterium]